MSRPHMTGLQSVILEAAEALGSVAFDPAHREQVEDLARAGVVRLEDGRARARRGSNLAPRRRWSRVKAWRAGTRAAA